MNPWSISMSQKRLMIIFSISPTSLWIVGQYYAKKKHTMLIYEYSQFSGYRLTPYLLEYVALRLHATCTSSEWIMVYIITATRWWFYLINVWRIHHVWKRPGNNVFQRMHAVLFVRLFNSFLQSQTCLTFKAALFFHLCLWFADTLSAINIHSNPVWVSSQGHFIIDNYQKLSIGVLMAL